MNRREFLKCSGTCMGAGVAAASVVAGASTQQAPPPPPKPSGMPTFTEPQGAQAPRVVKRREFDFEVEIVEGKCGPHQAGQKFTYPDEKGKICEWLMDSMNGAIRVLEFGGTMPWLYEGTPYQKVIDKDGLTTEFIRCPDPSRVVVAKISRRRV
jgi:uncharacterized repeat protein (TIGR04076 family)